MMYMVYHQIPNFNGEHDDKPSELGYVQSRTWGPREVNES